MIIDTKKYFEVHLFPFQLDYINSQLPNGYSLQSSILVRKREHRVAMNI